MTRRKPISHAVLNKLEPGEEFFPLIGRDRATPIIIKLWAHLWLQEIALGLRSESDRAQVTEALHMASRIEAWARDRRLKQETDAMEFNAEGYPLAGQHAKRDKNSTSGANDL